MDESKENRKIETKELVRQYLKRKYPDGDYCDSNCEFACVICNNAKSDMISAEDFTKFFVPGIKEYWEYIEEKLKCLQ